MYWLGTGIWNEIQCAKRPSSIALWIYRWWIQRNRLGEEHNSGQFECQLIGKSSSSKYDKYFINEEILYAVNLHFCIAHNTHLRSLSKICGFVT